MKVRATRTGYYDHLRRREGDVFTLKPYKITKRSPNGNIVLDEKGNPSVITVTPEMQFSTRWMEKVDVRTPEKVSTAQQAINKQSADIKAGRQQRNVSAAEEAANAGSEPPAGTGSADVI